MQSFEILQRWSQGKLPTEKEVEQLLAIELAIPQQAKSFDVNEVNGLEKIIVRSNLFLKVHLEVTQLCQSFGLKNSDHILTTLWILWLPLALKLSEKRRELGRTFIQGILGGQGTGKTTLAVVIGLILEHLGYTTIGVSLDDLYKTYQERQHLQQQDPRLIWRGPPGTHDVELGIELLENFRKLQPDESILVPHFDKSAFNGAGDRIEPEKVEGVDIVLFEGWFVGVHPVNQNAFKNPPLPIVTLEDKLFAKDSNERLKSYLPLWEKLDSLIVLYPIDYHLSKQWRQEAEQKMIASGKSGMSNREIDQFVEYFWKALHPELFIYRLISNPNLVDLVIEINADHSLGKIYKL